MRAGGSDLRSLAPQPHLHGGPAPRVSLPGQPRHAQALSADVQGKGASERPGPPQPAALVLVPTPSGAPEGLLVEEALGRRGDAGEGERSPGQELRALSPPEAARRPQKLLGRVQAGPES